MDLTKFILNSVLISVPEAFLLTFISLVFMKEYNLFYEVIKYKKFIGMFILVIIPNTVFSGYILHYLDYSMFIRLILNTLVLSVFILTYIVTNYIGRDVDNNIEYNIKSFLKVLLSAFISISALILLEFSTVFIFNLLGIDLALLNKNILFSVIFAIPSRLLMLYIIISAYIKISNKKEKGGI